MKHAFKNLGLALLSLIFSPVQLLGQLYEVSLDEKIEKSTRIVEGKVVESQCYRADNGNIYTANKVQLVSLLKGDYGLFFLQPTRVPAIKITDYPASFDVYSGVQGFVAFTRNEAKALVGYEPFHTYGDIPNDVILYPNPASNKLNIIVPQSHILGSKTGTLRIMNILGEILIEQKIDFYPYNETSVDLSGIPNGLLWISLEMGSKIIFTSKVIKL